METVSQNEKLDALLAELKSEVVLSDEEILQLYELYDTLEAEFGDIAAGYYDIFKEFDRLYSQVPGNSVLKMPFSVCCREQMHNREYYENREPELLDKLLHSEREILEKWSTYFFEIILPKLFGHLNGEIQNGGVKSPESIRERISSRAQDGRPQPVNFIRDLLRGRFVGETLADVEEAMEILLENSRDQMVSVINAYHSIFIDWRGTREVKPYVAANFTLKIDDNLTYELQLLTKRAALIGKLDHPVRIKRKVELPPELICLLDGISWGSHLLDFRKYLEK